MKRLKAVAFATACVLVLAAVYFTIFHLSEKAILILLGALFCGGLVFVWCLFYLAFLD